jgi:hypothetical protein
VGEAIRSSGKLDDALTEKLVAGIKAFKQVFSAQAETPNAAPAAKMARA